MSYKSLHPHDIPQTNLLV